MTTLTGKIIELEREEIINTLRECNRVMAKAARKLGITERMMGYKVWKYGIREEWEGNRIIREGGRKEKLQSHIQDYQR